jgi:Leucine-rich repeat (LRR) protein
MKKYSVNGNAELTINNSENIFNKKNYMKDVRTVYVPKEVTVNEFPTQEMVNSPTLKNVYIMGKVRKFRGDLLKKLKLETLVAKVHKFNTNIEPITNISEPLVLKKLRIEGLDPDSVVVSHSNNQRANLIKEVSEAKNLESLTLDGLHISKFPERFFYNFPKLTRLSLRENKINDPNELKDIGILEDLWELDLSYNKYLKRLPDSITKLKKLEKLKLFGIRELESLPKNIGNMEKLVNLAVSHNKKINIPESILKLSNNARVEYSSGGSNNNRNRIMTTKFYYNHWKYIPNVSIKYINQKIPNNGASNSILHVNFNVGNTAMRIKNANRSPTYMTVNTFKRLANTAQGNNTHIYKRRNDVNNIHDVYKLNGNTNVFINPMTTKMVKRSNIDFVKFT